MGKQADLATVEKFAAVVVQLGENIHVIRIGDILQRKTWDIKELYLEPYFSGNNGQPLDEHDEFIIAKGMGTFSFKIRR
ncbi:unnamed protein product [Adineta steineri]|uniref:Uncharacterized protein n=1 Tax=Adineta steineri TaxID=433720 RepID=A0A813V676_9BILA|nr:unnamed protein product [Adineta steineri]CAF3757494.1 unnamed protein product [Adineta steineri]CAF4118155.1 unnamed protein product [Adineta steineri]